MIVDIHAHCFPQEYTDLLMRIGGRTLPEAARPLGTADAAGRPRRHSDAPATMDEAEVRAGTLASC